MPALTCLSFSPKPNSMTKSILSLFFLLLLLTACNGKKASVSDAVAMTDTVSSQETSGERSFTLPPLEAGEFSLDDGDAFGKALELTGAHIVEPDTFVFKPAGPRMVLSDSLLLMSSRGAPFYAFTQPGFKYVKTIGRMGNGPDEFIAPEVFASDNPQYIGYLTDAYLAKVYGVDKDLQMHFLKRLFSNGAIGTYLGNICSSGRDTVTYQLKTTLYRAVLNDSTPGRKIHSLQMKSLGKMPAIGALGVNAERNRMVFAYKYAKIVKFMDLEAKQVRILNFNESGFEEGTLYEADGLDANTTHYMQVLPAKDYVFLTYSGQVPYDVGKDKRYYMYVEQYDWNGNPVRRYKLADFSINAVVSEDASRLILTAFYYDDPFIVYNLPK